MSKMKARELTDHTAVEHYIGDVEIKRFNADRHAQPLRQIVGQIWSGGDSSLMEKRFGLIGSKPWQEWMSQSSADLPRY